MKPNISLKALSLALSIAAAGIGIVTNIVEGKQMSDDIAKEVSKQLSEMNK